MGYFRGVTHGAIIGAIVGLLYAPDSGVNTRRRVSRLLSQADDMMTADNAPGAPTPASARRRAVGGTEGRAGARRP